MFNTAIVSIEHAFLVSVFAIMPSRVSMHNSVCMYHEYYYYILVALLYRSLTLSVICKHLLLVASTSAPTCVLYMIVDY